MSRSRSASSVEQAIAVAIDITCRAGLRRPPSRRRRSRRRRRPPPAACRRARLPGAGGGGARGDGVRGLGAALQRVEPVLDRVVRAPRQRRRLHDLAPACAPVGDTLQDGEVLGVTPLGLLDVGAQVVVPALAALLAHPAARHVHRDHRPATGAVLGDGRHQLLILLRGPRVLAHLRVAIRLLARGARLRAHGHPRGPTRVGRLAWMGAAPARNTLRRKRPQRGFAERWRGKYGRHLFANFTVTLLYPW